MLKLGVWKPEQFFATPPDRWWRYIYYRLSRSRISLRLLRSAESRSTDAFFERLMPHVQLSNGVYRTTFRQRFRNLDPVVNGILSRSFSSGDEIAVADWAASACLTSCEWAESLFPLFPQIRFVASDLVLYLVEVEDRTSAEIFTVEQNGRPLQCIRPPFVIRMEPPEPWLMPLNRIFYLQARRRWQKAGRLWPLPDFWLDPRQEESLDRDGYVLRKLPLIHPRALALAQSDRRFMIRRHSIFESAETPCHVIRSMNIFNRAYFSESELTQGIRSVIASLHSGGIWIVGRTIREDPPVHDVSIFRKRSSGDFELIERVGSGSEIESIVLGL
jgi:hypothetical protein